MKKISNPSKLLLISSSFILFGCIKLVPRPQEETTPPVPEISSFLLQVMNKQENLQIDRDVEPSDSLDVLRQLKTPIGTQLSTRYTNIGVPLVDALKVSRDRILMDRLFELAKWSNKPEVRSEALVALGHFSDPKDLIYFQLAIQDKEVGIRCAAIEALEVWGRPEGIPLLKQALADRWSPLVRTFAAKALSTLGDPTGLPVLLEGLDSRSWIIRALSARYVGDFATPQHIEKLYRSFNGEVDNDFVAAELAIAILKLISKQEDIQPSVSTSTQTAKQVLSENVNYWYGEENSIEMEPLLIIPPRYFIKQQTNQTRVINDRLISFLKDRLGKSLSANDESNPDRQDLYHLVTPHGISLNHRYSNLSITVAEGLGGTNDTFLRLELSKLAEGSSDPLTRSTALLSLAYNANKDDVGIISRAITSDDPVVRFGAMEAVQVGHFEEFIGDLITIGSSDPIPAFRIYADQMLINSGNVIGKNFILTQLNNPDWVVRAMSYWYLGRYGNSSDYAVVMSGFSGENNPFVQAEMVTAAQRLMP